MAIEPDPAVVQIAKSLWSYGTTPWRRWRQWHGNGEKTVESGYVGNGFLSFALPMTKQDAATLDNAISLPAESLTFWSHGPKDKTVGHVVPAISFVETGYWYKSLGY
jgi:hypothetical protein